MLFSLFWRFCQCRRSLNKVCSCFYKGSSLFCQKGKKTKRMPPPFEEHTLCPCVLVIYRKCLVASAAPTAIVDDGLSFFRGPLEFKKPNGTLPSWSDSAAALGVWCRRIVALTLAAFFMYQVRFNGPFIELKRFWLSKCFFKKTLYTTQNILKVQSTMILQQTLNATKESML